MFLVRGFVLKSFVAFSVLFFSVSKQDDVLCTSDFCRNWLLENTCTSSPAVCDGTRMASPTICNCCDFCLNYLEKGAFCSKGGIGSQFSVSPCGDGLSCQTIDGEDRCARMETSCHAAQDLWDSRRQQGLLGSMEDRPRCDGRGRFAAAKCIPTQTCFCQNNEGKRIFGETSYLDTVIGDNMQCGCSRFHETYHQELATSSRWPIEGPRCTPDGNFDKIQCTGNKCYCVDRITGNAVSNGMTVDLNENSASSLPCYDSTIHAELLVPQTESTPHNFLSQCERTRASIVAGLQDSEGGGFDTNFGNTIPECEPDGGYPAVNTGSDGRRICVDGKGQQIEDFSAEAGSQDYQNMNCKCARSRHTLTSAGRSLEQPTCCSNGNFRPVQCRRGSCRCVNADGVQEAAEVDAMEVQTLPCYTHDWNHC